jgi:hypothetical protein
VSHDAHPACSARTAGGECLDKEGFGDIQRRLRRYDARWYYGCRLRSLGARLLESLKYLDPGTAGAVAFVKVQAAGLPSVRRDVGPAGRVT